MNLKVRMSDEKLVIGGEREKGRERDRERETERERGRERYLGAFSDK